MTIENKITLHSQRDKNSVKRINLCSPNKSNSDLKHGVLLLHYLPLFILKLIILCDFV